MRTVGGHSFAAGLRMVGGHWTGVLGADVPSSGENGASPYYNDSLTPTAYYRSLNVTSPSGYSIFWHPDGSATITPDADGTYAHTYTLFENNISEGNGVINFTVSSNVVGTLSASESSDIFAAIGNAVITGVIAATEGSDIASFIGGGIVDGSFAATEDSDSFASSGTLIITGLVSASEQEDTFYAIGTAGDGTIFGTFNVTEDGDSSTISGTIEVTGTMSASEGSDTFATGGADVGTPFSQHLYGIVKRILNREGQNGNLYEIDIDNDAYDPETSTNSPTSPVVYPVRMVFLDFALLSNGIQTRAGTVIQADDKQVYLDPRTTSGQRFMRTPSAAGDFLIDAKGQKWRIMLVKEYNPNGDYPIMFDLLVRK